jgi:photosystem II stability/assembly factor-like uncharacterized protein
VKRSPGAFVLLAFVFVLALCVVAPAAFALVSTGDGSWYWRTPQPFGGWMIAGASVGDTVWAAGEGGVIIVSHDGGETWTPQRSGTEYGLSDITFVDADSGWAVGGGAVDFWSGDVSALTSVILHTEDGGATWSPQATPAAASLTTVEFTDSLHGWAAGELGTVLSTSDGGATWTARRTGVASRLTAVHFTDALHGWVGGPRGKVLRTVNGGRSWHKVTLPGWAAQLRILKPAFTDALHGHAIFGNPDGWVQHGSGKVVGATSDGGRTWRRAAVERQFTAVGAGGGRVWTVGDTAQGAVEFAMSGDGGHTWSRQIVNGILPDDVLAVGAGACCLGYAGAFSSSDGEVWLPRASYGYTPDELITAMPDGTLLGLAEMWDAGESSSIRSLTSTDAISWELGGAVPDHVIPLSLEAPAAGHAIAVGVSSNLVGQVIGTQDAGATWEPMAQRRNTIFLGSSAPDAAHVWVCGLDAFRGRSVLLFSPDWGRTWQRQAVPSGLVPTAVDFISADEGWAMALGDRGTRILHSTDGGSHWAVLTGSQRVAGMFQRLHFADALHGWALGRSMDDPEESAMLATVDGGMTWASCAPVLEDGEVLGGFTFTDAEHGFAWDDIGTGGALWRTADGGTTWSREWAGSSSGFAGVAVTALGAFASSPYTGVLSSEDLAGDTAAPSTYDDFDRKDHRTPVTVTLRAADVGGEVVATEVRIDDQAGWSAYSQPLLFPAPADHSGDGRHLLQYRSVDDHGNVEQAQATEVPIDTKGPTVVVDSGSQVRRGRVAGVALVVEDAVSRRAHVTVRFRRLSGGGPAHPIRHVVRTGRDEMVYFVADMLPGRYRMTVLATDDAGNRQSRAGQVLLVVRPAGKGAARGGEEAVSRVGARASAAPQARPSGVDPRTALQARVAAAWRSSALGRRLGLQWGLDAAGFLRLLGLDVSAGSQTSRGAARWETVTGR